MQLIRVRTNHGDVWFNPAQIASITPSNDKTGAVAIGQCLIHMSGGAVLPMPMSPEAMAKALTGVVAAENTLKFHGEPANG